MGYNASRLINYRFCYVVCTLLGYHFHYYYYYFYNYYYHYKCNISEDM